MGAPSDLEMTGQTQMTSPDLDEERIAPARPRPPRHGPEGR